MSHKWLHNPDCKAGGKKKNENTSDTASFHKSCCSHAAIQSQCTTKFASRGNWQQGSRRRAGTKVTSRRLKGKQRKGQGSTWSSCLLFSEGLDLDCGCVTWCEGLRHATRLSPTHGPVGFLAIASHIITLGGAVLSCQELLLA